MSEKIIKFKKLDEKAIIPKYQTPDSAGFDFHAVVGKNDHGDYGKIYVDCFGADGYIINEGFILLKPGEQKIIKTGLAVEIPESWQMEIRPRSGLAAKNGITITNSPGTIDSSYLDQIMIILFNMGKKNFIIKNGDRIAQGVMMPAPQFNIIEVAEFSQEALKNDRGGGFGSTGK